MPISVLLSGIITRYVKGNLGLGLNLICFFFNGLGVESAYYSLSRHILIDAACTRSILY